MTCGTNQVPRARQTTLFLPNFCYKPPLAFLFPNTLSERFESTRARAMYVFGNPVYGKRPAPGCFCSERGYPQHTFGCGYTGSPATGSPVTSSPAFGSEPTMPSMKRRKYVAACFCLGAFAVCFGVCCAHTNVALFVQDV